MQKNCLGYPVEFAEDAFGASPVLAETLKKATGAENPTVLIVADLNVVQRTQGLGSAIGHYVREHGIRLAGNPVVVSGGEKAKADSLQSALKVVGAILSARLGRNDVVLALGGGTVLDVAGYAAAQARGGVRLVRMPTTPAAMIDAAYADYAAVDSATVKDALRVPSVPAAVVIDLAFAATVLDGVWRGGIADAFRLGLASDASLVKRLVQLAPAYHDRDAAALEDVVRSVHAVRAKKGDTPFGQWAAARLEAMSGYRLPHGYAVSIGLCIDLGYAEATGAVKSGDREKVLGALDACGALDGRAHSGHLLAQTDGLLKGLDDWALSAGSSDLPVLTGLGKSGTASGPDREIFRAAIRNLLLPPPGAPAEKSPVPDGGAE